MTTTVNPEVVAESGGDLAVFTQPVDVEDVAEALREKTAALVVVPVRPDRRAEAERLYREYRARAAAEARRVLATAREAWAWMSAGARDAGASARSWWRRYRYTGEHRVVSYWLGRERSTAEQTGYRHHTYRLETAARRTLTAPPPSPEDDLPGRPTESIHWVGWIERVIEIMRAEDEALHPRTGHRFICS